MKLFVTGSIIGHRPGTGQIPNNEDQTFLMAATEIGYEAARAGHVILLRNVTSKNTVDNYVLLGAKNWCQQKLGNTAKIELHVPDLLPLLSDPIPPGLTITTIRYPRHGGPATGDKELYFDFLAATVRAVESCDVTITIGDGETVRMIGSLSATGSAPVLAIPAFGGSSSDVFALNRNVYAMMLPRPVFSALSERWQTGSAERIIVFAETLSRTISVEGKIPSYFISYSSKDAVLADHFELLLRRKDRRVLRDETFLKAGDCLPEAVAAMISQCDTFLVVNSQNYAESDWCQTELALALDKIKPKRIVYINIEDGLPPMRLAHRFGMKGLLLEERRLAIDKLIFEEREL